MRPTPVILILLSALLAGCSDSGESKADDAPVDDLQSTATTGVIRGIVLDETITPIAGVTVTIPSQANATSTSDAEGRFGFDGLEGGTYILEALKVGHQTVRATAKVVAGVDDPLTIKVTLPRLPETVPYIIPIHVNGLMNCEVLAVMLVESCDLDTGVAGDDTSQFFLPVDQRAPHAVQVELDWESTQQAGESLTLTFGACNGEYCSPYGIGTNMLCQTWGTSVLWCNVNQYTVQRSGEGAGGSSVGQTNLGVGASPGIALAIASDCAACTPPQTPQCGAACGVGLVLQQEFDAYTHVFYNFTPDEGWLFLEDGNHPVPDRA